jgi:hypothetical protein
VAALLQDLPLDTRRLLGANICLFGKRESILYTYARAWVASERLVVLVQSSLDERIAVGSPQVQLMESGEVEVLV